MRKQIKTNEALFCLLIFLEFMPGIFENTFTSLAKNCLYLVFVIRLFTFRYKPNKFLSIIAIYFIYVLAMTCVNKTGAMNFTTVIFYIKLMLLLTIIDFMLNRYRQNSIKIMLFILLPLLMANALIAVLFPKGLYQVATYWGIWTGYSYRANWLFGNKNTQAMWYLMAYILSVLLYCDSPKRHPLLLLFITLSSLLTMVITSSDTSLIVMLVAIIGALFLHKSRGKTKSSVNPYYVVIGYLVVSIVLLVGSFTFLDPLMKMLFDKTATFSNRTQIWELFMLSVVAEPIFGHGIYTFNETGSLMGNKGMVNAHNQLLDTAFQGGILLVILYITMLFVVAQRIKKVEDKKIKTAIAIMYAAYLISLLMEVFLGYGGHTGWVVLYLIYKVCDVFEASQDIEKASV